MKQRMFLSMIVVLVGAACIAAQQKMPPLADTLKAVKDTLVKNDSAVKKDAAGHFGKITVTTAPETAEVSLDSVGRGTSPCTLDSVAPGAHVLIVKRKGYLGKKVGLDLKPDSTLAVDVALVKPSALVVSSTPPGAQVLVDGKEAGATPLDNVKMKPGDHVLRIVKDGYATMEKQFTTKEGAFDTVSIALVAVAAQPAAQAAPPQQAQKPAAKHGIDTVILIALTGLFVLFGVVILGVESGS